jgi:hypothetical protein
VRDNPELLPVCYRCGTSNPLLSPLTDSFSRGDSCASCGHPFVRSFLNFDVLPLVEFAPAAGITDEQALDMIRYAYWKFSASYQHRVALHDVRVLYYHASRDVVAC